MKFLKDEYLTHTVNFGIEFVFSKAPGSVFSEGLGPDLFYKYTNIICQVSL